MDKIFARRWPLYFLLAITLSACAGTSGVAYDPYRCDRNGDENQRRSC
jgi:hypothetical protein